VLLTPFQKQRVPLPAMHASLVERRSLLEVCVVPCAQKEQKNMVITKQMDPTRTITPVSGVPLVIGPTVVQTNAFVVQKDFIPIKLNRTVAKFVKLVVTIRMRRVLKP
jgi:hypothetical protein